ncbi:HDOD domain-containing protein [Paraglaciecola sp.]|uniref:HDOD domain-containing protein n=1 Tax=Paraglaciecola sp. TaxID=1920173 RepID=UPI0030F412FB
MNRVHYLMNAKDYAINADDIFVLPEAVVKIKQLIDDETASMYEIAEIINYDPAIMSQVLKISNSALYKFTSTISTVSKAIQVIGTRSVYDLVLAYGIANAFKSIESDVIDLDRFWERGVSCGLLAKYFAEELGIKDPERLFVCGLLHNLGELVMVKLNPEIARTCSAIDADTRPLDLELANLGFSYAEIAAELMKLWGLPVEIYQPIKRTHPSIAAALSREDQILQLSYILSVNNVFKDIYSPYDGVNTSLYEPLGLDLEQVDNALDFTNLQLISAMALFSPSSFSMY